MSKILVLVFILTYKVVAHENSTTPAGTVNSSSTIVDNLTVSPFLDGNGYIRLNISWNGISPKTEMVSLMFKNSEECNPINDIENFSLRDNAFLIVPDMELTHPADHLSHGCEYEIVMEDEKLLDKTQQLCYKVPECVENKCECKDVRDSPYVLKNFTSLSEELYSISWEKLTEHNLTVHEIYYQRKNNNTTRTLVDNTNIVLGEDAVELSLNDLKRDMCYRVTVTFLDSFNECVYFSSIDITVPPESHTLFMISGLILILTFASIFLYTVALCSPRVRNKLETYLNCFQKTYNPYTDQNTYASTPFSLCNLKEEVNAQYTPLEWFLQVHKYDEYEFPRNKILITEQIGEGAFGTVCSAKAYELGKNPGYTMIAVKQLKVGAPQEGIEDFKNEIVTLKKIGEHKNIVKLLGCVTMDEPYMILMELVPCGSLKNYLLALRKKWAEISNANIFFPEDMNVNWLQNTAKRLEPGKLKYTSCLFENSDSSYIEPEVFPESPNPDNYREQNNDKEVKLLGVKNQRVWRISEGAQLPHTPSSYTSSRLPSSTDTETTNLESETRTPNSHELNRKPEPEPILDHTELQEFAFQIASGMAHLEKIQITHRDLAARNVLITADKVLKITDFGMSRTGTYVSTIGKIAPFRWMAIDAIEDRLCDSRSDVWSFGVVLWEIGTLGAFPYQKTPDCLVLHNLKMGERLDRPKICTDELYGLMLKCWRAKPEDRPLFRELVDILDVNKRKVYVGFNQINPKYVFPPTVEITEDTGAKREVD